MTVELATPKADLRVEAEIIGARIRELLPQTYLGSPREHVLHAVKKMPLDILIATFEQTNGFASAFRKSQHTLVKGSRDGIEEALVARVMISSDTMHPGTGMEGVIAMFAKVIEDGKAETAAKKIEIGRLEDRLSEIRKNADFLVEGGFYTFTATADVSDWHWPSSNWSYGKVRTVCLTNIVDPFNQPVNGSVYFSTKAIASVPENGERTSFTASFQNNKLSSPKMGRIRGDYQIYKVR
jgi:hypothetical protein